MKICHFGNKTVGEKLIEQGDKILSSYKNVDNVNNFFSLLYFNNKTLELSSLVQN